MRRVVLLGLMLSLLAGCALLPWRPPEAIDDPGGIGDARAVAIARRAAPPLWRDGDVLELYRAPYGDMANEHAPVVQGERPDPGACVYVVNLGNDPGPMMGSGVIVVLGCGDGRVIRVTEWIS